MKRFAAASAFALVVLMPSTVSATTQRTFVASTGVDTSPCSLTAPCRSFARAITQTNSAGEVIVLDSAGYGPVVITKSISIIAPPGIYAGVSVFSGDGISVAGAALRVSLRGITINNQGSTGVGINFTGSGGALELSRVRVSGFDSNFGVLFTPTAAGAALHATDLTVVANLTGIGIAGSSSLNVADAILDRVDVSDNNSIGLQVSSAADVVVAHGTFAANHTTGVLAVSGSQNLLLTLEDCELAHNSTGLRADGTLGTVYTTIANSNVGHSVGVGAGIGLEVLDGATVRLAATTITQNATGILVSGTGVVQSQGNNLIFGNTSDGPAPTVVGSK